MKPFLPGAAAASGALNTSMHLVLLTLALVASVFFLYRELRRAEYDILEAVAALADRPAPRPAAAFLAPAPSFPPLPPFVFGNGAPVVAPEAVAPPPAEAEAPPAPEAPEAPEAAEAPAATPALVEAEAGAGAAAATTKRRKGGRQ